jgi:hypothetical protein
VGGLLTSDLTTNCATNTGSTTGLEQPALQTDSVPVGRCTLSHAS